MKQRKATGSAVNTAALRLDYLIAASWFWVKATGSEQLVSALNRLRAQEIARELGPHNTPSPEEVCAYARDRWPEHKLHAEAK